jgi:hypothetical protein
LIGGVAAATVTPELPGDNGRNCIGDFKSGTGQIIHHACGSSELNPREQHYHGAEVRG